jgi:hypothetical protein
MNKDQQCIYYFTCSIVYFIDKCVILDMIRIIFLVLLIESASKLLSNTTPSIISTLGAAVCVKLQSYFKTSLNRLKSSFITEKHKKHRTYIIAK